MPPNKPLKPLGRKAYGSIPHLLDSRLGPGDHHVDPGQNRIATHKARDRHDRVIVTEKLDGANVAVMLYNNRLTGLNRKGYPAGTSPYRLHHIFQDWLDRHHEHILPVVQNGVVLHAEWLLQTHGVRYRLPHGPLVVFDVTLVENGKRLPFDQVRNLAQAARLPHTAVLSDGPPVSIDDARQALYTSNAHGALSEDGPEGVVWRVERRGAFDFMAKWVRPDKIDGRYLPEISGAKPLYNTCL